MQYKSMLFAVFAVCLLTGCGSKEGDTVENNSSAIITENADVQVENENSSISYAVGDVVTFGSYEQDDNEDNGAEPIEWIVLDTDGSKALLLSKYVLDEEQYDYSENQVTWYTSNLFQWLNADFKNEAFSDDEKNR